MFKKISGLLSVALCFILVGSSYPIAKEAMDSIPIWIFTSITFAIGFLFLFPLTLVKDKTNWVRIGLKDWLIVSILSLLGAVLYTVFLLYGLPSTSALTASVITSAAPAVVLLITVLFFKEKLRVNATVSVLLAVVSVVIMTLPGGTDAGSNTVIGLLFLSLSTLANALNIIIANKIQSSLKPLTMAAGVCLTGTIFSLPLALHDLQTYQLSSIAQGQIFTLLYYGVFVWALPYIFFFKGVNKISAASAGMCVALIPVASMLCSVLFFGDSIKHRDLIATIIIIISVVFSETDLKKVFTRKKNVTLTPDL